MPIVAVRIPQIGEGLQEARLVAVLKQPGDRVRRDEAIYQMETDKAVMDVESPYDGVITEWVAAVDTIIPIGDVVAKMDVADGVEEMAAGHGPAPAAAPASTASQPDTGQSTGAAARRLDVPPRTRAYAKEKGLSEADLANIPASGSKLMPEDVDTYLSGGSVTVSKPAAASVGPVYQEQPVNQKQRLLASRLVRGAQLVVPGTISVVCDWGPIETLRGRYKSSGGEFQPSAFTMFAYAVSHALKDHAIFRSTWVGEGTLRTYDHVQLGIAVGLPGDELVLAVVQDADKLDWPHFAQAARERIDEARNGKDQANESVTISLTNMQGFGLRDAVPVVVSPAVATLFIGEVYSAIRQDTAELELARFVNLTLTFDHRLVNGVGASNFLNDVRQNAQSIGRFVSSP